MADDSVRRDRPAELTGAWAAQAVAALAQLGLADLLYEHPLTCAELAERIGAHPGALSRLLRLLESHDLVESAPDGAYALTPAGALLARRHPCSLAGLALFHAGPFHASWAALAYAVTTGRTFSAERPEPAARSERAREPSFFTEVPLVYDFTRHESVVDVGGGDGALLAAVLSQTPGLRGTLFDASEAVERARVAMTEAGLAGRCSFAAGDLLEAVPAGGDVYLLSRVPRDRDDEPVARVLANCRAAMGEHGRLLMIDVRDGAGRTRAEYARLLESAGLVLEDVRELSPDVNVLVAAPRLPTGGRG
ncbi:methyltransferase [Nonomuraea aridisoli]|nr:methyltransferase [Nonomuraea aridisoli]